MSEVQEFYPPKNAGIILHGFLILALLGGSGSLIYLALSRPASWSLILFLFGSLLLIALLPLAAYRAYALWNATYSVERDGLRVRWGLRSEDIPLTEVIWVRPAIDLETPLKLPWFSIPGAILGASSHPELGNVEFIASRVSNLVIVSSTNKILVLSPQYPEDFVYKFQRLIEMGSIYPIQPHSAVPAAFIRQMLIHRNYRILISLLVGLDILLILVTSLLIPLREMVSLGYDIEGMLLPPVKSNRLLLLPVISTIFMILDLVGGTFFFRRIETRQISVLIWAAGILTPLLFTIAVLLLFVNSI